MQSAVTPAFGRLAAVEARLDGEYRSGAGESEEVAFNDGGARERDILTRAYLRLIKQVISIYKHTSPTATAASRTQVGYSCTCIKICKRLLGRLSDSTPSSQLYTTSPHSPLRTHCTEIHSR
ncbi:hypothetical protein EDB19DRAFT_1732391 [Suillus lakei]|nr:hypothetical protein EDB19DRAFT_1732391 [Suillus lakei]